MTPPRRFNIMPWKNYRRILPAERLLMSAKSFSDVIPLRRGKLLSERNMQALALAQSAKFNKKAFVKSCDCLVDVIQGNIWLTPMGEVKLNHFLQTYLFRCDPDKTIIDNGSMLVPSDSACQYLDIGKRTLTKLVNAGLRPVRVIGRKYYFDVQDLFNLEIERKGGK